MKIKKSHSNFYIINGLAVIAYIICFFSFKIDVSKEIMYHTTDAKSYLACSNWLGNGIDNQYVSIRPILYPLILLCSTKLGGVFGIWIVQILLWLFTINFTFLSIQKLTKKSIYAFFGTIVLISNLSLISLTFHALTEITTTFLLSIITYFIISQVKRYKEIYFIHGCLLLLVLLTILKPLFLIPLLIVLFIILPVFYFKSYIKKPFSLIMLVLLLIPFIIQLTIMKVKYDEFTVSTRSSETINNYFLTQGIQKINNIKLDEARKIANSISTSEKWKLVLENKTIFFSNFFSNIEHNIKGKSVFLSYPVEDDNNPFIVFMKEVNKIYFILHILFIISIILLSFISIKLKIHRSIILLSTLTFLFVYIVFTTGFAFFQGDRLVLPSISIWTCLYPFVIYSFSQLYKKRKSRKTKPLLVKS